MRITINFENFSLDRNILTAKILQMLKIFYSLKKYFFFVKLLLQLEILKAYMLFSYSYKFNIISNPI